MRWSHRRNADRTSLSHARIDRTDGVAETVGEHPAHHCSDTARAAIQRAGGGASADKADHPSGHHLGFFSRFIHHPAGSLARCGFLGKLPSCGVGLPYGVFFHRRTLCIKRVVSSGERAIHAFLRQPV